MAWKCTTWLGTLLVLATGAANLSAQNPVADDAARVKDLVRQLGSNKFSDRERAKRDLEAIGAPALTELRKAAAGEDLETSKRATELVRKIEERQVTAELLTPKRVRLQLKDATVADAVRKLSTLSGYPVQLQGDLTRLAGKKLTLDTGDVSFWEALDQLCQAAGLDEKLAPPVQTRPVRPGIVRPQPALPIRNLPIRKIQIVPGNRLPAIPPANPAQPAPRVLPAPRPIPLPAPLPAPAPEVRRAPKRLIQPIGLQVQAVQIQAVQAQEVPAADAPAQAVPAQAVPAQAPKAPPRPQVQPAVPAVPPVQIQIQGGQIQIQPGIGRVGGFAQPIPQQKIIVLEPGQAKKVPTSYAGSVRVRALPLQGALPKNQHGIVLDVDAEPSLENFGVVGTPTIHSAIDDQGQELVLSMEPDPAKPMIQPVPGRVMILPGHNGLPNQSARNDVAVRFQKGARPANTLKELSGTLNCQAVRSNQILAKLDDVLKAPGKSVDVKAGGTLTLASIEKTPDGKYRAVLRMANMPRNNPFNGRIILNGNVIIQQQIQIGGRTTVRTNQDLPVLVDAAGKKYAVEQIPSRRTSITNGQLTQEMTVVYRGEAGAGDPASLILHGSETVHFQVPFRFTNVPLTK